MKKMLILLGVLLIAGSMNVFGAGGKQTAAAPANKELSILWSSGGNGDFVNYAVEKLRKDYGLDIDLEYNTQAHEILRPQIIAGNPPDIVMVQHGFFNYFEAIQQGAFTPISKYLDLTVADGGKKVIDVIGPELVDAMRVNGDAYILLSNVNVSGLYYDAKLFRDKGWRPPTTWDEFIALCDTIKRTEPGIAPFIYPGMYPYYLDYFFMPNVMALGDGAKTMIQCNNMEKGIWSSGAVLGAAKRIQEMRDKGFFYNGLISLNHTAAQMEFINRRAAMVCSGSWLDNEMAGNWPADFELTYLPAPTGLRASDARYARMSGNLFGFPSAAKNKDYIDKFLQIYYSNESAERVAGETSVVISSSLVSTSPGVARVLSKPVLDTYQKADNCIKYFSLYNMWYPEFYTELQNLLTALVSGQINADEFCTRLEAKSESIRNDSSVVKYSVGK